MSQQHNYASRWVGQSSDKGPTRSGNEDAFWVPDSTTATELGALYIVADGVGGQQFGAAASWLATETIQKAFYRQRQQRATIPNALRHAIHEANVAIIAEAKKRQVERMGSTVVTAVQDQHTLYIAHVGDARAYLLRNGHLRQLTRDDTWVQRQVDAGVITAEEAINHELRNVVTQVLGNKQEITVHLMPPLTLENGDVVLLCSDGVYDAVLPHQIQQILTDYEAPEAAPQLIEAAKKAKAKDNITAVVLAPHLLPDITTSPTIKAEPIRPAISPTKQPKSSSTTMLVALGLLLLALGGGLFWYFTFGMAATAVPDLPTPNPLATVPSQQEAVAACIVQTAFLWQTEQLSTNECAEIATQELTVGTEVQLLADPVQTTQGPDAICGENRFVRVQTEANQTGWVLETAVSPLPAAQTSCTP